MRSAATLVVLALLVLVAGGLLLVGVATVRGAAARSQCRNNLRQLGMALHNYRSAFNDQFPTASMPNPLVPAASRFSWLVTINPFLEASPFYSRLDKEKGWDAEENRFAALTRFRTFECPAYPDRPPTSTLVPTHYVGLAGLGADAAALTRESPRAGFFGDARTLTFADVEGHAATLLVAVETAQASGAWTAAGPATVRGLDGEFPPYLGPGGQFGGTHPGGATALFADASVRFLPGSLAPHVFEALATVQGSRTSEPVGEE
jgi:prepilin-type processing-associated H-X9-DG protein